MTIDLETLEQWRDALRMQYQLHSDYSITPRASRYAPTASQLFHIREAHLNIQKLVMELIEHRHANNELNKLLHEE